MHGVASNAARPAPAAHGRPPVQAATAPWLTPAAQGAAVTLLWETAAPYEAVVEAAAGGGVTLRGLRLRHASPSVANNAAVFCRGGTLTLEVRGARGRMGAGARTRLPARWGLLAMPPVGDGSAASATAACGCWGTVPQGAWAGCAREGRSLAGAGLRCGERDGQRRACRGRLARAAALRAARLLRLRRRAAGRR